MKVVTGIKFLAVVGAVALATASVRANLIVNPGFEDPTPPTSFPVNGWALNSFNATVQMVTGDITTGAGNVHSGNQAALLTATGTAPFEFVVTRTDPGIPITPGLQYMVSFWLKALPAASTEASVKVKGNTGALPIFYPTESWAQYSYLTSPLSSFANPTEVTFEFTGPMGTQFYFDDVSFSAAPVPEPGTLVAGALLLLPLGVRAVRMLRKSREGMV